jgi:hypothetical protein
MNEEWILLFMATSFAIKYSGDIVIISLATNAALFVFGLFGKCWSSKPYRFAALSSFAILSALICIGIYYSKLPTA